MNSRHCVGVEDVRRPLKPLVYMDGARLRGSVESAELYDLLASFMPPSTPSRESVSLPKNTFPRIILRVRSFRIISQNFSEFLVLGNVFQLILEGVLRMPYETFIRRLQRASQQSCNAQEAARRRSRRTMLSQPLTARWHSHSNTNCRSHSNTNCR